MKDKRNRKEPPMRKIKLWIAKGIAWAIIRELNKKSADYFTRERAWVWRNTIIEWLKNLFVWMREKSPEDTIIGHIAQFAAWIFESDTLQWHTDRIFSRPPTDVHAKWDCDPVNMTAARTHP